MSESLQWLLHTKAPAPDAELRYGAAASQRIELFRPAAGGAPWPLLVCLHGGFWRARYDATHLRHACRAWADDGWLVASVEYRRVGEPSGGYPNTLQDARDAADGLLAHAAELGFDPQRVAYLGHSAGGQMALWLAAQCVPWTVRGVLALAPVADLRAARALALSDGAVDELLAACADEAARQRALDDACPSARLPQPGVLRVLLHGAADEDVPCALSASYCARAAALGDEHVQLLELACDHYEPITPHRAAWAKGRAALSRFLSA